MSHDLSRLGDWADLPFFANDWPRIRDVIEAEADILPPDQLRFAALERCQPNKCRAVILGQDPYPTPGHAHGLAFSVTPDTPLPRSLNNIFKEMEADIGAAPETGDLRHLADQGVLLLNTSLSVPAGKAGAHAKLGWSAMTEQCLDRLQDRPRAYVLWGRHAQAFRDRLTHAGNLVIETAHPSPLSARKGFFGSKPFSRVNNWLAEMGGAQIDWVG